MTAFANLPPEVRACTHCAEHLPLGPRPVLQANPSPRNDGWLRAHPWFGREPLPAARARVAAVLSRR